MPASFSKNDNLIFNKFLRNYQNSLQHIHSSNLLCFQQIKNILNYLGYIDQYTNQHSQQLIKTICYMLSENKDSLVSKINLFQFLRIISDVKKFPFHQFKTQTQTLANDIKRQFIQPLVLISLGSFTQNGQWKCNDEEEKQIKAIFGSMNLKRISRQNIDAQNKQKHQNKQNYSFKPSILQKSRSIADSRQKKLCMDKKYKVQDRLMHNHNLQQSRLEQQLHKSIQKQMKQCYFKPKINTPKRQIINYSLCKNIQSLNTSFQNKQNDKSVSNIISHQTSLQSIGKSKASLIGDKLLIKGKQYQEHKQKLRDEYKKLNDFFEMNQCTFQPKIFQKAHNNNLKQEKNKQNISAHNQKVTENKCTKIRNVQKSIQRVKQARKKRQFQNKMKQRGYPQNVEWTKFISSYKSQKCTSSINPILCIDLKIMDQTKNIKVFEGQKLDQLTEKICIQNNVPHQFWSKVEKLLKNSIQQCRQIQIFEEKINLRR